MAQQLVQADPAATLSVGGPVQGWTTPYFGDTVGGFDSITIGPIIFQNTKITIDGAAEYKIDVKPAPGLDGASEKLIGYVPAKVVIAIELWNAPLFAAWGQIVSTYKPKPGKTKPVPLTVDHPLLGMMNLSRFYVTRIPVPKFLGNQTYEGRLELVEYFAQPKASGTQAPSGITGASVYQGDFALFAPNTAVATEPGGSFEAAPPPPIPPDKNNVGPT